MGYIGYILGFYSRLYGENGKEHGNDYNGLYRAFTPRELLVLEPCCFEARWQPPALEWATAAGPG